MAKGISLPVVQSGLEASIQEGVKNVGKINIPATVDPSAFKNLAQPLGRVSGLATEFEKSIAASNARVLAFGASVGIINGVQNAFADLVRTGIEVQKTLADIAAISGQGGKQLSQFGDALFDIGKTTGQTFKTAAQAALEFSRQGLSVEDTLKRTTDALTLTRFTTLNAAEAVDVLTAAANSFSETGITTAQIINKLVAVDTKFAVSAEDLANGLARAGSIAQEVGVNFDQLNAAITIAQERTARGGAVIGNALKTIFTRLRSDETVEALRSIGVESLNAQGQLKGAIPLLEEVAQKLQGLSGGERVQILEAIASKYNINILSALLNDLNGANSKFSEAVAVSAGASNQAYERQIELNKTLAAQINNATVSVTQLFNKLSEIGVTDSLATLLKFVSDLINGFNKIVDSEGLGGNIAKGLIKGISDVFFTVGLPIIGAIFIKLTRDIAQFGIESLKTILGINQQVRERQALEQAVVNTLIQDQQVMASILALSGNRAKQEEYLLGVYNRQLNALQQVKNIAATVTPALMSGGLTATSGRIERRGAGGYLPAQEAADVRRGVGGANPSSKVVSIPNFAFGGGKRGTMIANTSEYIVPNFANGGSAIFNKDMARAYGLPAGAKKISAAGGYVPNFARYVYDADRIQPDKNALLKAILASGAKKNLIVGPAGSGKSTYGASLGSFITNPGQLVDATEIDILSGAARTKDGGISKNFQQIADAVNASGGKISYLYTGNMDILSRRSGRISAGPAQGDLRSQKQIAGSMYAPLNQFDFISKVKGAASNFEMIRGAKGYIPNFAEYSYFNLKPEFANSGLPTEFSTVRSTANKDAKAKIAEYAMAKGIDPKTAMSTLYTSQKGITKTGVTVSSVDYPGGAVMLLPDQAMAQKVNAESMGVGIQPKEGRSIADFVKFKAYGFSQSSVDNLAKKSGGEAGIIGSISDSVANVIYTEGSRIVNLFKPLTKTPINNTSFKEIYDKKGGAGGAAKAVAGSIFEAAMDYALNPKDSPEAQKAISAAEGKTFDVLNFQQAQLLKEAFNATGAKEAYADYKISDKRDTAFADQIILNSAYPKVAQKASIGYIPNFAAGSPLGDAINREMAAGVSPSKIRITQDGRLRNAGNPNGLAVINTRDEPNGRIPNFAFDEAKARKNLFGRGDVQGPMLPPGQNPIPMKAARVAEELGKVQDSSKKLSIGMDKMLLAMSATMMATSTLEATFGKTDSAFGKAAIEIGKAATSMSQFASLGALIPGAGIYGAIGGAVLGAGMYAHQYATEPTRIAAEQRTNAYQQQLNPQGDLQNQILQVQRDLSAAKMVAERAKKDIAKSAPISMYDPESNQQLSVFASRGEENLFKSASEDLKAVEPQIKSLEDLYKKLQEAQKKSAEERALVEKNAKKELEDRVALSKKIGEISISYAKGEAAALTARTARYAILTENATSLTEVEKRRAENALKVADIEERINNIGKETLFNLIKEVADKSKLANISEEQIEDLRRRFEENENLVNLEEQSVKLGIQGAANLRSLLIRAKENSTLSAIKLKAEKESLETQLKATEAGSLQATQIKNRLALLDAESSINQQIVESQRRNRIEQEQFDRGSALRSLKKSIATRGYATPQEQGRLANLENETRYADEIKKIEDDLAKARDENFFKFKDQAAKQVETNTGIAAKVKPLIIQKIKEAKSIDEVRLATEQLAKTNGEDANSIELINKLLEENIGLLNQLNTTAQGTATRAKGELQDPREAADYIRNALRGSVRGGISEGLKEISIESSSFSETFGKNTTIGFRDGLRDAMSAAISQTDDLNGALQNVALNFLKTMQSQFLNQAAGNITTAIGKGLNITGMAKGGLVTGGSGYRDDVPRMLTGGEFVMRKSAVQKYGAANLAKMNSGGIFLPGVRGGGAISGYDALRAFANQTTTSGATDVLRGGGSSAFINLEDQSSRLSRFALLGDDTINQEIRSAQEQGLNIIAEREKYRTEQRKAFQKQLVSTIGAAALNYGIGALTPKTSVFKPGSYVRSSQTLAGASPLADPNITGKFNSGPTSLGSLSAFLANQTKPSPLMAYGGLMRRYAAGGPTDDIPALLMSGEYVMNRGATSKYGKRLLDSMNQGRAPRFADGGEVGTSTTATESNAKMMGDVSININVTGQNSQTETQGNTNQGGIDYKKMSERIKAVVLETINEEKRLGGSLRPGR